MGLTMTNASDLFTPESLPLDLLAAVAQYEECRAEVMRKSLGTRQHKIALGLLRSASHSLHEVERRHGILVGTTRDLLGLS